MSYLLVLKACVNFVKVFEDFIATIYEELGGIKTLGYGVTGALIAGMTTITEVKASAILENIMNGPLFGTQLNRRLTNNKVTLLIITLKAKLVLYGEVNYINKKTVENITNEKHTGLVENFE